MLIAATSVTAIAFAQDAEPRLSLRKSMTIFTFSMAGMAGQFSALNFALEFSDEDTVIVPGHGMIDHECGLSRYKKYCSVWAVRVGELHRRGMTAEEMTSDQERQRIKDMFFNKTYPSKLQENRFTRFVDRTLSADFIAAYPLTINELSNFTGEYRFDDGLFMDIKLGMAY